MIINKKEVYLGVDQTGAVNKIGQPQPLPACLIEGSQVSFFYLESFTRKEIENRVQKSSEVLVCVDCVLGLPQAMNISLREALRKLQNYNGYGRTVAKQFFADISNEAMLRRQVEVLCQANSVFKEKPYQKNIQTGSYRIWKDIAISPDDFVIPFLSEPQSKKKLKIYEGYPSLSWKLLFDVKSRVPDQLIKLVSQKYQTLKFSQEAKKLLQKDVNLADAFVLALSLKLLNREYKPESQFSREGWILGAENK